MKCHCCGKYIDLFSDDTINPVSYAIRVSDRPGHQYKPVRMCSMECAREFDVKQSTKRVEKTGGYRQMTKKELIFAMIDMPDSYSISIHCGFDARDPSGLHEVVSVKEHKTLKIIELQLSED